MDANGNVMYEGEWRNGKRNGVGEVLKGTRWVGHWKDGKMNGMGYEKDGNGVMKRGCLFENGEMKRVVQEFDGGKMVEYDENGRKVYEGEYKGNVEKGFVREGFGKEYRMVEERKKPTNSHSLFCCWVREVKHEVAGVELVTKKYREEVVVGYWRDGKKNGMINELDRNGKAMRGCLYENDTMKRVVMEFKGSEMVEYDRNGKKVYEGGYGGDMINGYVKNGNGKEMDASGREVFVGEWRNGKKNGEFYELDGNGIVVRICLYENSVIKRVIMEFHSSIMTEFNIHGKKVYEGEYAGDMESGFVRNGRGREFQEEVLKRVCVYKNGERRRVMQEFNGSDMIEYDRNGKKVYEGGYGGDSVNGFVRDGKGYCFDGNGSDMKYCVFGDGCVIRVIVEIHGSVMTEYDDNGKKKYVGGFKGDRNSGFVRNGEGKEMAGYRRLVFVGEWKDGKGKGKEMDEKGRVVYEGEWKNGMRNGEGKEMDASGRVVKSGKWVDGEYQEMIVGNNGYNDESVTELKLSGLARLKRIAIGDSCFGNVRVFELDGLDELESVMIGQQSFRIDTKERNDGSYRTVNCPKLKSIQIGDTSFYDYHSFELNNLPSLQSIDIGDWCFEYAPSFSLTDLPQLQSLKLAAFRYVHSVVFENLPKLQSIQLGRFALEGDNCDDRKTIGNAPYNYKNTLTMRSEIE
ncbi:hypothetical protein WA538_001464 [Blastocystis sp. DL]